ncbi:DctP family TRAP transporter solute-binding subunit [Fictibacillus terranigra]|uniref:DctP family TRAP transporter solute-binding subunit n=1 Tax=Fictibacillus terranigra TaxID=3058424 RepID=A0ABT8E5J7_9BACL|nr:DctP family TRAP transporter solute-binding subunit [Fictibacillus sp. CENA-BCM004]MDN4073187.1 DctP family TRAP transporter solute-binding subunit [Fictibacillus sp. CENA-BCM004]
MKQILGISVFLITGLLLSFYIGFHLNHKEQQMAFDDDQSGIQKQIVIKFSHVVAENTPKGLAAQKFADLVEQKSDHRVKVEVFPNGSLYTDKEELDALKSGKVQMIAPATSKLGGVSSKWQVLDLPFAFPTESAINEGLNGDIGKSLLASLEQQNIKGLGFWVNGLKQITNKDHAIIKPNDFKDEKFRIMSSVVLKKQFELLDGQSKPIDFNETYRNLESGNVTGEENTISNIYSKKYYRVQDYMTISNHGFLGYAILMNEDYWHSLPLKVRVLIQNSINETVQWNQDHYRTMNKEQLRLIKKESNIQIHELTPYEKQKWIEKLNPMYKQYEPIAGRKLISDIRHLQRKYERQSFR